jgi:trichohyalin
METIQEATLVSPIETALAKENVTNQVIQKLRENYLGLTINGIEDKQGFKKVEEARKECKSIRNLAVRICKKGREDAIQIQKEWIAKEKEVVAAIEEVEGYLESQSNEIKELEKKILFEAAQKEKLPARKEKLLSIGFEIADQELLKIDDNQYDALYNDFYKKHLELEAEKIRLENERIAAQKAEEERIRKQEEERKAAEERALIEAENARLKAEADAREKILAEERAKAEEERKAIEAEARRKQMEIEAKAKAEREAIERAAAEERARQEAILKAEQEAKEKIEAELKAKIEAEQRLKAEQEAIEKARIAAEKKAAKAPIKEQLNNWIQSFQLPPLTKFKDEDANNKANTITLKFESFKKWAESEINTL